MLSAVHIVYVFITFSLQKFSFPATKKFRLQVIRQFLHLLDEHFNNKLFIKNRHIFLSSRVFLPSTAIPYADALRNMTKNFPCVCKMFSICSQFTMALCCVLRHNERKGVIHLPRQTLKSAPTGATFANIRDSHSTGERSPKPLQPAKSTKSRKNTAGNHGKSTRSPSTRQSGCRRTRAR